MSREIPPTERSKIKTNPVRAVYDAESIRRIIDESFVCHMGFAVNDQPFVIPVCYGRKEDRIYFHGARGSRIFKTLKTGAEICVTISILDGIVLARSAFNHTINYRSVVIFGKAHELNSPGEKTDALKIITEHIIPGRWDDVRKPTEKELHATSLFSLKINEASAKIRTGPPLDDEDDLNLEVWAGVLPLKIIDGKPIADISKGKINGEDHIPEYLKNYKNRGLKVSVKGK
ncbi:MAG TPA: pyridoxamine 5'-phosphate oxidase family protein [Ignavibacteriaceae bacterium]|nr:pyridoxamine 5'-phosphate oxidase family protein [Ignavibacteriaceae bacterium]